MQNCVLRVQKPGYNHDPNPYTVFTFQPTEKKKVISHWLFTSLLPFSWPFKTWDFLSSWYHGESPIPHSLRYKKSFNHWNASTSTSKSPEPVCQFLSHLNMSLVDLHHRDASLKFCYSLQCCNLSPSAKNLSSYEEGKNNTV